MRLVSNNSDRDLAKRETRDAMGHVLREMAANLIRVVRGAGRPHSLGREMAKCLDAFEAYRDAHTHYPDSYTIQQALDPQRHWPDGPDEQNDYWERLGNELSQEQLWSLEHRSLREDMRRAALQITASMLVEQRTQRSVADRELGEAVRAHERVTEERRLTRQQGQTPARSTKAKAPKNAAPAKVKKGKVVAAPLANSVVQHVAHPPAPSRKPQDPFKPPGYSGIRSAALPPEIREEFAAEVALDLVKMLNELWKAEGKLPLAQGSYPSNSSTLAFVVKELRLARARNKSAN